MAAKGGHGHVLEWARENGCRWSHGTCDNMAREGHLDMLKSARKQGAPWGSTTTTAAAEGRQLEVLQWMRSPKAENRKCPWNEQVCHACADNGNLEMLEWAREQGCPWNEDLMPEKAVAGGHLEVLQYAFNKGVWLPRKDVWWRVQSSCSGLLVPAFTFQLDAVRCLTRSL